MDRRDYLQAVGGIALGGTAALAGCSALETGEEGDDDTVAVTVGGTELWMAHRRESRGPGSTSVVQVWPDEAWIDERIEPRIDADNDEVDSGDSLAELPVSEIAAELDAIRTWVVFALELAAPDDINDNETDDDEDGYHWYAAPTAFFDRVVVGSEHTFRVAEPDGYYDGSGTGRVVDVLD